MPGNDLRAYIPSPASLATCIAACCASTEGCGALVYEPSSDSAFMACLVGQPCCYLKTAPGLPVPKHVTGGIFAVNVSAPPPPAVLPPPLGVRSAVPLGGVGAGSVELRGDGSLHEWTIVNQSPGEGQGLGWGR